MRFASFVLGLSSICGGVLIGSHSESFNAASVAYSKVAIKGLVFPDVDIHISTGRFAMPRNFFRKICDAITHTTPA
jgi:hypothetical protein